MGRLITWIILIVAGLLIAVGAGIGTHWARPTASAWASGIYMGLLALTLLAVLWYSVETRKLVRIQRETEEIADHPWLKVEPWPVLGDHTSRGHSAHLPITNVGRTPATVCEIVVGFERLPEDSGEYQVFPGGDANPRALAPGQGFVTTLVKIDGPPGSALPRLHVDVSISYRSLHGGDGLLQLRFRYADGVWKSRDTKYQVTLSSGLALPG